MGPAVKAVLEKLCCRACYTTVCTGANCYFEPPIGIAELGDPGFRML